MKILMVTNTYLNVVGGLERSVQSFTRKYREWGHEVLIAGPDFVGEDFDKKKQNSGKEVKKKPSLLSLPFRGSLERKIAAFKPDIIHVHHPFLMGEMALRFSAYYAKPVVFTYHILFGHYAHYLPSFSTAFSEHFLVKMTSGFCNHAVRVIAPSESVHEVLTAQGVHVPIDVVPTGIEITQFENGNGQKKRKELEIPEKAVVFGYAGRFAEEKNLDFLAQNIVQVMKENPEVYFLAVGKGPSQEQLEKIFTEAGVAPRLKLAGTLNGQDLTDAYHAMDAFTFASKSETQGLVLCEAMAGGIPVIAIDAPGVREVVRDFENGRLLAHEDGPEFQAALVWFIKLEAVKKNLLKQSAKDTAAKFSLDITARKALKTYQMAMEDYALYLAKYPGVKYFWPWRCVKTELQIIGNLLSAFLRALAQWLLKKDNPKD